MFTYPIIAWFPSARLGNLGSASFLRLDALRPEVRRNGKPADTTRGALLREQCELQTVDFRRRQTGGLHDNFHSHALRFQQSSNVLFLC